MLQLQFNSIAEATLGSKWQTLFNTHWSAYKAWFISKNAAYNPPLDVCKQKLKQYMPEWLPTYEKLCNLSGNDPVAHRFLTGWQPPAYITGCSQAVFTDKPQLVRNYDYHPHLSEGTVLNSAWNGKHVMAVGDCLIGVVDGMNADGLVVSLTFGGRKVVGDGFGIPFILRYVLEFCSNTEEAVEKLKSIPSHMAYNVMVLDKTGSHKMVQLAPDKKSKVTDLRVSTNHQGKPDWPEHAAFSKTIRREEFLQEALANDELTRDELIQLFLKTPLFNRQYNDGFGTVYTSVYRPAEGYMEIHWQDEVLHQSFAAFEKGKTLISYSETAPFTSTEKSVASNTAFAEGTDNEWNNSENNWSGSNPSALALQIAKTISGAMGLAEDAEMSKALNLFTSETKKRGQIPWEMLADVWAGLGKTFYDPNK